MISASIQSASTKDFGRRRGITDTASVVTTFGQIQTSSTAEACRSNQGRGMLNIERHAKWDGHTVW